MKKQMDIILILKEKKLKYGMTLLMTKIKAL